MFSHGFHTPQRAFLTTMQGTKKPSVAPVPCAISCTLCRADWLHSPLIDDGLNKDMSLWCYFHPTQLFRCWTVGEDIEWGLVGWNLTWCCWYVVFKWTHEWHHKNNVGIKTCLQGFNPQCEPLGENLQSPAQTIWRCWAKHGVREGENLVQTNVWTKKTRRPGKNSIEAAFSAFSYFQRQSK